jgi:hypothetical protein
VIFQSVVATLSQRRLAGFRFEAQPPELPEKLPRMDIPVLVGFAQSGPVNLPVPVESAAQFEMVFGEDLPLAWRARRGAHVSAHLGPCVRDFFRNGGRRCWIIRVAGQSAAQGVVPVPGLLRRGSDGQLAPAHARARAPGSWFDGYSVATALTSRLVPVSRLDPLNGLAWVRSSSTPELQPGDLLRMRFSAEGLEAIAVVQEIHALAEFSPPPTLTPAPEDLRRVNLADVTWLRLAARHWPATSSGTATTFHGTQPTRIVPAELRRDAAANPQFTQESGRAEVRLALEGSNHPIAGEMIRLEFGGDVLWLNVRESHVVSQSNSPPQAQVQIAGEGRWVAAPPLSLPVGSTTVELLKFELWVRRKQDLSGQLVDLAFAPAHLRYWNALPHDEQLFRQLTIDEALSHLRVSTHAALWREAADPRFALAGDLALGPDQPPLAERGDLPWFLPVGMTALPEFYLPALRSDDDALTRDGLNQFDASLFLDSGLVESSVSSLARQVDFLRYQSSSPRLLTGLHAAWGLEEATMIAVPDAAHPGWVRSQPESPRPEPRPAGPPPRDWATFSRCDLNGLAKPHLELVKRPDAMGTFELRWQVSVAASAKFVLEEAGFPDFSGTLEVYRGEATELTLHGRAPGDYYYRVRAEIGANASEWSDGLAVRVKPASRWQTIEPPESEVASPEMADQLTATLLNVHRALLRLCAARGDLLAVLSLPEHFQEDESLRYLVRLKSLLEDPRGRKRSERTGLVQPLSRGEKAAFSYATCYHPWLVERDEGGELQRCPPDGAALGGLARRSLTRGAWIAPANELIRGPVALEPPLAPARRLELLIAQLNVIRQESTGFTCLSADTLSSDPDLRPISVRRLLMLLRRLALQRGVTYVFEPNDDALRRLVQHGFEASLNHLFARGAFAGRTPAEAFRVNTSISPNTPQSVEQGRFIVELKVAPSLPLTFITLRLVQTNERGFVTELR